MIFFSDKLEKNAPKVEKKLRKELKLGAALAYDAEVQGQRVGGLGQFLADAGRDLAAEFTGSRGLRPVYMIRFDVPDPACEIRVSVVTDGKMVMLGGLLYTMAIGKAVVGDVRLQDEQEKRFFRCKFVGEVGAAGRLNGDKALVKRVNRFVRDSYMLGQTEVVGRRYFRLQPYPGGALLSINTLPRSKWFGLTTSFDAPEFFTIARAVAAAL